MNIEEIRAIVAACAFRKYKFDVLPLRDLPRDPRVIYDGPATLRARFMANDIITGKPAEQLTRRWILMPEMTKSEIVATCLKCVLTSEEHEAREDFTFCGVRIFGPHFDVEALLDMHKVEALMKRMPQ